jgi:hypothetical protein
MTVAVVGDRQSPHAARVQAYLQANGVSDATWYAPRNVDDVEQALRAGEVQRVVFPQTADFLELLWDELLTPEVWQTPGLRVEFAGPDGALLPEQIAGILETWGTWRRRRRRQRAVAGLLLSALAIAAAWILVALAR